MNVHRNGIALTFARTDNRWFFESGIKSDALLFLKGRIAFIDLKDVTKNQGGGAGSLFMAWGDEAVEGLKRLMNTMPDKCFFIDLRREENKLDNPLLIGDLI